MMSKIEKEKNIVVFMIEYYCKQNHHQEIICKNCSDLVKYAHNKLKNCLYRENKPSCLRCKVHCYSNEKREEIKKVMAYVGPKMIYLMPTQYIKHIINKELYHKE